MKITEKKKPVDTMPKGVWESSNPAQEKTGQQSGEQHDQAESSSHFLLPAVQYFLYYRNIYRKMLRATPVLKIYRKKNGHIHPFGEYSRCRIGKSIRRT